MTHLILALMAGLAAIAAFAQEHEHGVSRKDAEEFIDKVERELPIENEYVNRVAWIASNFITPDTEWLSAKVTAERAAAAVVRAKTAARFDGTEVDPLTRRKLELMKRGLTLAPPEEPGARTSCAPRAIRRSSGRYGKGGTRSPFPCARGYSRLIELANSGARALGYSDTGVLWRSWYDMPAEAFSSTTERLWSQLAPMYRQLHCYARARLNERYGAAVQPRSGPTRRPSRGYVGAIVGQCL
jgi:peptidyl-dipeptidase A